MNLRYVVMSAVGITGITLSLLSYLQYNAPLVLVIPSVLSVLLLILVAEVYSRNFDHPLFFIRDEMNYWGGAFGGLAALVASVIGMVSADLVGFASFIPLFVLATSIVFTLLILYTATVLQDINEDKF